MQYSLWLIILALVAGCSHRAPVNKQGREYQPDFVQFFPRHKGLLFGLAHVVDSNANMARQKADENAQFEVVFRLIQKTNNAVTASFVKAQVPQELFDPFLVELSEVIALQDFPEVTIDRREYVDNTMYSLAKCEYTPEVIERIRNSVHTTLLKYPDLHKEVVARHLVPEMNERIDLLEEY